MAFGQIGSKATARQRWLQAAWLAVIAVAVVVVASPGASRATGNFTPTIKLETSTTRAAAHPDARITIDNSSSSEEIKDLTIDLPNGFMGSLNAAPQCEVADAQAATCPSGSAIGTVTNYARVDDSDVKLQGTVYLTEALPPNDSTDPAGLQIVVPATIGGVTLDPVVVNARVQIRHADLDPGYTTAPSGTLGPVEGVRTIVTDIPTEVQDSANNRTVEFSLQKLVVDLRSDQSPPFKKLLTNPSACGPVDISAQATSYNSTGEAFSDTYTVDQCESVEVGSAEVDFVPDNTTVSTPLQFSTSVTFADDTPAVSDVTIGLPAAAGISAPGFGVTADRCNSDSFDQSLAQNVFNPVDCPSQAKFATVEIETPLLPDPLSGELYFIEAGVVPNIGLYVDPSMSPDNPAGVEFGLVGLSTQANVAASCASPCSPITQFKVQFPSLPDVPLKRITVTTDGVTRVGDEGVIPANFLSWVSATDTQCIPNDDTVASFLSHVDANSQERPFADIDAVTLSGCDPRLAAMTDAPFGGAASTNPPTLTFQTVTSPTRCAIDLQTQSISAPLCNPVAGTSTFTPPGALTAGAHYLFARSGTQFNWRPFIIEAPAVSSDATGPVTQIDSGPTSGTTSETTPTWDFSADEDAFFECSIDDGAFVLCDPGASAASSGTFTVADADRFYAGTQHTFAVRARDEAGNLGAAVEATVDISVEFAPSLATTLSTTQARAHPDLDVTISSESEEDLKTTKVALPDGLFGGLTGVQSLCPLAVAAAGNCTDASKVGTVETEARVDDGNDGNLALVRISGKVYLTESAHAGEPAGLSIKVPAVIQDLDLGDIIVSGRLQVRGQAQGVDSLVVDIPDRIIPDNGIDTETEFDMRSIVLKLRTGPGASHPLLTNPSSCNGSAFVANFTGYGDTASADANGFAATGCEALAFTPNLVMSVVDSDSGKPPVNGSSSKPVSANLTAVLTSNPGDAAIKDVSILMPRPLTINVLAIPPACEVAQYADGAGQCPATSIVGNASAVSPLLPEALSGTVYLLKQSNPAKVIPRLLIALRGRINIDIIADNSFENLTQIRTTLNNLPDVPLSSFTLNVDRILSTRNEACTVPADEWSALGQMSASNGRTAPVNQLLVFGCKPKYSFTYRKRAKRTVFNVLATGGPQRMRNLTVRLPRGVVPIKKNLKRKLVVSVDGKRLSRRCYKVSKKALVLRFCGKSASIVSVRFRAGSLSASRKAVTTKRLKRLSISAIDSNKKRIRFTR